MSISKVHFSSETDEWETPPGYFAKIVEEFGPFDLDVCATAQNAKSKNFFTKEDDGLARNWSGRCWMNPPYGKGLEKWVRKAYTTGLWGGFVVCLIPSRTDTAYWHDYVMKGEVRFIRGRLNFGGHANPAPFPSALVIFGKMEPDCGNQYDID